MYRGVTLGSENHKRKMTSRVPFLRITPRDARWSKRTATEIVIAAVKATEELIKTAKGVDSSPLEVVEIGEKNLSKRKWW